MTYRITTLAGSLGMTCPPPIVAAIFPAFDGGWPVTLSESECLVTVPEGVTPLDISPLVKVEALPNE